MHHALLEEVLTADMGPSKTSTGTLDSDHVLSVLEDQLEEVEHRVATLLFLEEPIREQTDLGSAVLDIQVCPVLLLTSRSYLHDSCLAFELPGVDD